MHPQTMITALEREREQNKNDENHVKLIDEQLAYWRTQPLPAVTVTEQGAVVQDRTEAYLAALRVEKERYPKRAKEIDKEIAATEAGRVQGVSRAVTHVRGVQTATIDNDLED
jgi:hypothetical protein